MEGKDQAGVGRTQGQVCRGPGVGAPCGSDVSWPLGDRALAPSALEA